MINYLVASTGFVFRVISRRIKTAFKGIKKYPGNNEKIGRSIISNCYDKKRGFKVSNGHFQDFYCRDFGINADSLIKLGYKNKVIQTLDFVLDVYSKNDKIDQTINPYKIPYTFPNKYTPDSLAFIIHSLRLTGETNLIKKHESFLNKEINLYFDTVINKNTGLIKKGLHLGSMKDFSIRSSSCYDNCVTGMMALDLKKIKILDNPFKEYNYKKLLMEHFWTGDYFLDDLSGNRIITGDANTFPFWAEIIKDKKILNKTIDSVKKEGLDKPFPIKYCAKNFKKEKQKFTQYIVPDYQKDSIWAHMGIPYIQVVAQIDKKLAKTYLNKYTELINKYKNFLEIYDRNGKPFKTLFYITDESMIWVANYLWLMKTLK